MKRESKPTSSLLRDDASASMGSGGRAMVYNYSVANTFPNMTEVADDSTALMLAIEENSSSDIWDDVTGISDATSMMTTLR